MAPVMLRPCEAWISAPTRNPELGSDLSLRESYFTPSDSERNCPSLTLGFARHGSELWNSVHGVCSFCENTSWSLPSSVTLRLRGGRSAAYRPQPRRRYQSR